MLKKRSLGSFKNVFSKMYLKCPKHFYFKLFSLVHKVEWLQVLLCITNNSVKQSFIYTQLNVKTVLFQIIQFSISTQFSSIWPKDRTLSCVTTPSLSGPGCDVIAQNFSSTETSPLDCIMSYPGLSLGESNPFSEMHSTALAYWSIFKYSYLTLTIQLNISHFVTPS